MNLSSFKFCLFSVFQAMLCAYRYGVLNLTCGLTHMTLSFTVSVVLKATLIGGGVLPG